MSNNFDAVTQSDWQGQYSLIPPGDANIFPGPYHHVASSNENAEAQAQPRSVSTPSETSKPRGGSPLNHRLDPLGLRQPRQPSPVQEQLGNKEEQYLQKTADLVHEEPLPSTETPGMSLGLNPISSVSSAGQTSDNTRSYSENAVPNAVKDGEQEVADDEEMMEAEAERDGQPQPQTAAERTAQRRKMKRFRYFGRN